MIALLSNPPSHLDRAALETLASGYGAVCLDLGAGSGEFVYRRAKAEPAKLWIGIDAAADSLREVATRVARKPARGGLANAKFVTANVESLPSEFDAFADFVSINFPWGSLLRGIVLPGSSPVLSNVRRIAKPGAVIQLLLNTTIAAGYHDARVTQELPYCDTILVETVLTPAYAEHQLRITAYRAVSPEETREIGTAWGKRLAHSRDPGTMLIEAIAE